MRAISPLLITALTGLAAMAHGQDPQTTTPIPDSVRAYLEQSQGNSPFTSMARMQVGIQYEDFLNGLGGGAGHRSEVEQALVAVLAERAELSNAAVSGRATPAQLEEVSSYEYLRKRLSAVLNSTELQLLDARQEGMAEEQLRKNYSEQMARIVPDVTNANKKLVLDVLVKHMLFRDGDAPQRSRMSAEELVQQQLLSLRDARVELQDRLEGEQLDMVNYFLNDLRANLFLNQSMSDGLTQ